MSLLHSPDGPSRLTHAELREALVRSGWRYTRQREAVYEYLVSVDTHPTAEEVYTSVRESIPKISLATVYKALEALADSDLATKLSDADGPARYDCRNDAHYHLRDVETGRIHDLDEPFDPQLLDKLDSKLVSALRDQGIEVLGYRLEIRGRFLQPK